MLTGCQNNSLLKHLMAKVTGEEVDVTEKPTSKGMAAGLSDEQREVLRERYKDQNEAYRDKRDHDATEEADAAPTVLQSMPDQE